MSFPSPRPVPADGCAGCTLKRSAGIMQRKGGRFDLPCKGLSRFKRPRGPDFDLRPLRRCSYVTVTVAQALSFNPQ